ncbi:MAG: AAA family ATPase [Bacteroidales bacterium]|nr:AAA family ATPase [Bacteroidales bacterium]
MGFYINRGNSDFRRILNSEYIDKTGLIAHINSTLDTNQMYSCVTRSRRFGKTMAAETLCAYYDKSCDSRELFNGLEIASDPSFEKHLNKYAVIFIDITTITTRKIAKTRFLSTLKSEVKAELVAAYPQVNDIKRNDDLMATLLKISLQTGEKFIMIIDEWDAICREFSSTPQLMDDYINLLRRLFKGAGSQQVFAGVYLTGILPIKKYNTESALNNFTEYSMINPEPMAKFFGFTKEEVMKLCAQHNINFDEMEEWYDGYTIGGRKSMFNPNSVMKAIFKGVCSNYWGRTGNYEIVADYIKHNFLGLKDDLISMIGGARCDVSTSSFGNDMSIVNSKDDVLTVLIHLGYLSYDRTDGRCYIPNKEVREEVVNAIRDIGGQQVIEALSASDELLKAILRKDSDYVAKGVERVHDNIVSLLTYNNEVAMSCVITIAFYSAINKYVFHRELATGKGVADIVMIPRKNVELPAVVIELKYNHSSENAIAQIKNRNYPEKISEYTGKIILAGIIYDPKTKAHECVIEEVEK